MNSIYRFTLNMHSHRSQASVSVFKGDTAIRLIITLVDGGNPFAIKEGCVAILSGTKADGNKLWDRCVIVGNTIQYDFHEQTATCMGITNCEVTLYDTDGSVLTAPKFTIVVDEREITSTDFDSLPHTDVFDQDKLVAIYEAEESRAEAEKQRAEAEVARQGFLDSYRDEVSENIEATVNETKVELASNIETAVNETKVEIYNILGQTIIAETTVVGDPFVTRITGGGLENIVNNSVTELVSVQGSTQEIDGAPVNATFSGIFSTGPQLIPQFDAETVNYAICYPARALISESSTLTYAISANSKVIVSIKIAQDRYSTTGVAGGDWENQYGTLKDATFTVPANFSFENKHIYIRINDGGDKPRFATPEDIEKYEIMVNKGKEKLGYVPYTEDTLELPQPVELGEGDYIDVKSQTLHRSDGTTESIICPTSYAVWNKGNETILTKGQTVTVTQKYITKVGG